MQIRQYNLSISDNFTARQLKKERMHDMNYNRVEDVIQTYFDAGFESSAEKMASVFNDAAHIYGNGDDETLRDSSKEAFVKMVEAGSKNETRPAFPRYDEIISIDYTGEDTAVARVKIRIGNTMFTDILSFIRLGGKWTIISKLYSGVPAE